MSAASKAYSKGRHAAYAEIADFCDEKSRTEDVAAQVMKLGFDSEEALIWAKSFKVFHTYMADGLRNISAAVAAVESAGAAKQRRRH